VAEGQKSAGIANVATCQLLQGSQVVIKQGSGQYQEAGFFSHKNPCRWLSTGLLRRCHKSSAIVFLPQFDEENAQMSRLDAFSLNTVPSIVLRKHRYILSKHIFIKSSSHLQAGMLQKRESQKLKFSVSFKLKVKP